MSLAQVLSRSQLKVPVQSIPLFSSPGYKLIKRSNEYTNNNNIWRGIQHGVGVQERGETTEVAFGSEKCPENATIQAEVAAWWRPVGERWRKTEWP